MSNSWVVGSQVSMSPKPVETDDGRKPCRAPQWSPAGTSPRPDGLQAILDGSSHTTDDAAGTQGGDAVVVEAELCAQDLSSVFAECGRCLNLDFTG